MRKVLFPEYREAYRKTREKTNTGLERVKKTYSKVENLSKSVGGEGHPRLDTLNARANKIRSKMEAAQEKWGRSALSLK